MTVSNSTNSVVYRGNGAATEFAVPFKVLNESHLVVTRRDFVTGELLYTYTGTDFTYSGIGDDAGTLTLAGTALDDDFELVIERIVPYTQELDIVNSGGFYPETVENQLDLIIMGLQQAADLASRGIVVPVGEAGLSLPKVDARGGMFITFDVDGNLVATEGTGSDGALRADLADPDGATLINTEQDIDDPTPRALYRVLRDAPWRMEDKGGGPNATEAEGLAAWDAVMAQFDATTERGHLVVSGGEHRFSGTLTFPTYARNITVSGAEDKRSVLRVTGANNDGIHFPNGLNNNCIFERFTLYGDGEGEAYSGTGNGFDQDLNGGANDSFQLIFRDVVVGNFGGDSFQLLDVFNCEATRLEFNWCGGHGLVWGGNTLKAQSCYGLNLPGANKAAYRILAGNGHLDNCNSLNSGDIALLMGSRETDGDDSNDFAIVQVNNCNFENFSKIGIDNRAGCMFVNGTTTFLTAAGVANAQAIRTSAHLGISTLETDRNFGLGAGASWKNGYPVHVRDGDYAPFSNCPTVAGVEALGGTPQFAWWDDTVGAARTMNASYRERIAGTTKFVDHLDRIRVISSMHAAVAAFPNYADDAAAATGGLAVGDWYRTGSIIKMRVA